MRRRSEGGYDSARRVFVCGLLAEARIFFVEHLEQDAGGNGTPEEPSLCVNVLLARSEVVGLNLRLDAFNDDAQSEGLGHGEYLGKNRYGDSISTDSFGESLVDLDRVD